VEIRSRNRREIFVITGEGVSWIGFRTETLICILFSKKRKRLHMRIELRIAGSESMDSDDASVDTVVSNAGALPPSSDPEQCCSSKFGRKLRPGEKFIFIEHVAAKAGSTLASPATFLEAGMELPSWRDATLPPVATLVR